MNKTKTPTKGAGATFWRLSGEPKTEISEEDIFNDEKWNRISQLKELTPGEITVEDEEDNYLDDDEPEWTKTTPGQKTAGEVNITIAWKPGEIEQKQLANDLDKSVVTFYRAKYPNGTCDVWYGYVNKLGKAIAIKDKMTRTVSIKPVGKPKIAEWMTTPDSGE